MTEPYLQVGALAGVINVIVGAGKRDHATRLAASVEDAARRCEGPELRSRALAKAADAAAAAGEYDKAKEIARSIRYVHDKARALAAVALALAAAGDRHRAGALARSAESAVRSITDPGWAMSEFVEALTSVAHALATAGNYERARAMADAAESASYAITIALGRGQSQALANLAIASVTWGDTALARRFVARAFTIGPWLHR